MKHLGLGLLAASVLISAPALAEPGEQGQLAVGAERLMGFSHSRDSSESEFAKSSTTINNVTLLASPMSGFLTAYSVPRVAFDYFPTQGFSVGGAISYTRAAIGSKYEPNEGTSTESDGTFSLFVISPRVGYAAMFNESVGIWPRAGITYLSSSMDDDDSSGTNGSAVALSIEAPLLFMPVDNVAISLGPTIDYGLSSSRESTDDEGNTTEDDDTNPSHEFGVQGGIVVFF